LTGAILFAATTFVADSAHAAVLSAGLSTVNNGDGTFTVLVYAKTDTGLAAPQSPTGATVAANSGAGFWDGISGFGFDVIGTSGAFSFSGNSTNDINAGDVNPGTNVHSTNALSTIDPAPAAANTKPAYSGNNTIAALNGSFSPKPSPATTGTNAAKEYELLSTLGTPNYGAGAKSGSFASQSGGGFDTVPTSGPFAGYSLIDEQIWTRNTNAGDNLRLFIIGGAQYNHAATGSNFQTNYPNGNFEGTSAQIAPIVTGPSISLTSGAPGTSLGTVALTRLGAGSYLPGGATTAGAVSGAMTITGLNAADGGNVPVVLSFSGTASPTGLISDASTVGGTYEANLAALLAAAPWVSGLQTPFNLSDQFILLNNLANPSTQASADNLSFGGFSSAVDQVAAVPEPTTISLAGIGAVLAMGRRRRQA
jgi:hypothetical protein